jgi:MoaA/NifB/PqqE/SkfB family radical SAM enzyme
MTTMKRDPINLVLERDAPRRDAARPSEPANASGALPSARADESMWRALQAPVSLRASRAASVAPEPNPLLPPLPRFAQVEPVGRCNLACRMCAVNQRPTEQQAQTMSVAQFDALLAQLPGLQELHLQGLGEPMLHPEFFTLVEHAVARGIRVSANTNATLITPARARRCVESGLSALSISLDGGGAQTYESIRQGASFAKVTRNIERLVRARRAMRADTPALRLVMVLMKSNLAELPALVELAAELGVFEVLVQRLASDLAEPALPARYLPVQGYLRRAELRGHDLAEASEVFAFARERAARLGVSLHLPRLTPGPGASGTALDMRATTARALQPRCAWPFDKLYVTAGGEALPCCMVGTPDRAQLGNVLQDGVRAVWTGPAAQQWRAGLLGDAPGPLCRGCALYRGTF